MFLVKHVTAEEADKFSAHGFRFSQWSSVIGNIAHPLSLTRAEGLALLQSMHDHTSHQASYEPGLYVACFGVQAQVSGGFRIMVNAKHRLVLPSIKLQDIELDNVDNDFISKHHNGSVKELVQACINHVDTRSVPRVAFRLQLKYALEQLSALINDRAFLEARLIPYIVSLPAGNNHSGQHATQLLLFRYSVSINASLQCPDLVWSPFGLFNTYQASGTQESTNAFARHLHHEFSPLFSSDKRRRSQDSGYLQSKAENFGGIMVQHDVEVFVDADGPHPEKHISTQLDEPYSAHGRAVQDSFVPITWAEKVLRFEASRTSFEF